MCTYLALARNCQLAGWGMWVKPCASSVAAMAALQNLAASLADFWLQLPVTTKSASPPCDTRPAAFPQEENHEETEQSGDVVAFCTLATAAGAQIKAADGGKVIDNWQNGSGELVWKNGTNELCWRDANWTPATAAEGCDGALVVKAAVEPAPAPAPPAPVVPPVQPTVQKVTYAADAFFDFDKSVLKPEGRGQAGDLSAKSRTSTWK
ncbi:hypothetical protein FQA39_LY19343 [Lamprigera yunnana]|nr:hypothetical protein FQA39_LY19343 [Lamprigera yunnana]